MKTRVFFLALCMIVSIMASGQERIPEVKVSPPKFIGVANVVEVLDEGKVPSITQYLAENFQYPNKWGLLNSGTEVIKFTVTPKGELANFKVINSIGDAIDDEIIRLLKATNGMWKPGRNNGEPIAMEKEVAMEIRIGENEYSALGRNFTAISKYSFNQGAKALLIKGNAKRALRHYDRGVQYSPYDKSLLLMRGVCRYEVGNTDGARQDWIRLKELGGVIDMESSYFAEIKHLKGYQEFAFMFK